jgi:hypothetical protein
VSWFIELRWVSRPLAPAGGTQPRRLNTWPRSHGGAIRSWSTAVHDEALVAAAKTSPASIIPTDYPRPLRLNLS